MEKNTICAISTPAGVGGIAVIRVSGPAAIDIAQRLWKGTDLRNAATHTAHLGTLYDPETDAPLDQAVATVFRAPRSFTGEDVVELGVHGSLWIQRQLLTLLINAGATLAEPGEFTRRAFANGKLDLAQVEAVADVIAATSRAAHRVALSQLRGNFSDRLASLRESLLELASLLELELDFSEEDVEFASRRKLLDLAQNTLNEVQRLAATFATGDTIRRGIPVAIIGHPNVGKSSLLNRLIGDHRAIVSDIAGTTRDTIEETIDIDGQTYRFIDTAGLRDTADTIENLGIERAWEKVAEAKIILYLTEPNGNTLQDRDLLDQVCHRAAEDATIIKIINKADLLRETGDTTINHAERPSIQSNGAESRQFDTLQLSALTGKGIDQLINLLKEITRDAQPEGADSNDAVIITNVRHFEALKSAATALERVIEGLRADLSGDFIAQDLRESLHHLSAITGAITTPEILSTIFSRFCIGK